MKIEKNSLIIAYIGFLIISGIVYIASVAAHFDFESWKRIIAAATIASYWFSLAGVSKTTITISNRIIVKAEKVEDFFDEICVPFWEKENNGIKSHIAIQA